MRPVLVPIDLGGSPTRCTLSLAPQAPPSPELVEAMIAHYAAERCPPGASLEVAFFRGGLPGPALLEACGGLPVRIACSPADLSPEAADALVVAGVRSVELEVLCFDNAVLRELRRGYSVSRVEAQRTGLSRRGLGVGLTLMPGLPGSTHLRALEDAERAATQPRPERVRIYPALALEGSELAARAEQGRWRPMRLGEAVTTVAAMLDRLDAAGIPVARVGLQPGQDLPARVVAGPWHPNLRGLVEGRRFRRRMAEALAGVSPGGRAALRVNPKDLGWIKGTGNENVRAVRVALGLESLDLIPDPEQLRGQVQSCEEKQTGNCRTAL